MSDYNKAVKVIDLMSEKKKARSWCKLNSYGVPKKLEFLKDEIEDVRKRGVKDYNRNSIVSSLMRYIEKYVDARIISYYWWKQNKLDLSRHSDWWNERYGGTQDEIR